MPKVSVIIPVYNVEKYLCQCLDSVANQTLKDIEIICVNDCSKDNSLDILNEYAKKDSRIKIINFEENKGPGVARNAALDIAQGEYIMFLDPDDWYELNACETAYNQIVENNNDIVIFANNRFNESTEETRIQTGRMSAFLLHANEKNIKYSDLDINWFKSAPVWIGIYKRDLIEKNNVRFAQLYLCEDVIFTTKVTYYAKDVSIITTPLYNHRIRDDKSNQSSKTYLYKDLINSRVETLNFINEQNNHEDVLPYALYIVQSLLYWFNVIKCSKSSLSKDFYNNVKNVFINIEENFQVLNNPKAHFDKHCYKKIIKKSYFQYIIGICLKNIFDIRKEKIKNKKKKKIYIFGKQFKFFSINKLNGLKNFLFSIEKERAQKIIQIFGLKIKIKRKISLELFEEYLNLFVDIRLAPKATGHLRKIQLLELYLMKELKKICDEIGIKFWLRGGTALGAYRHKGFIPWDDDVDLGMLRDDFDKLFDYVNKNSEKYEIVYFYQRRNKVAKFTFKNVKGGVYIDLFPFDWCPYENRGEFWAQWLKDKRALESKIRAIPFVDHTYTKDMPYDLLLEIETQNEEYKQMYNKSSARSGICYAIEQISPKAERIFATEMIFPLKLTQFEDTEFYTINKTEDYLTFYYGDYMKFPLLKDLANHEYMFSENNHVEVDNLYEKLFGR